MTSNGTRELKGKTINNFYTFPRKKKFTKVENSLESGVKASEDLLMRKLDQQQVDQGHGAEQQALDHDRQLEEDGHGQKPDQTRHDRVLGHRAAPVAEQGRGRALVAQPVLVPVDRALGLRRRAGIDVASKLKMYFVLKTVHSSKHSLFK